MFSSSIFMELSILLGTLLLELEFSLSFSYLKEF